MRAKDFIPASKPRNFVAKNSKTAGAGAHKDKKRAEKQGDVKHKKPYDQGVAEGSEEGNLYAMALQKYPQLKRVDRETVINALNNAYEDYLMHYGYEGIGPEEESSMIDHVVKGLKKGVAEGLPQTLRKVVPGYAKREIDRKMDAEKFGRTDVDRDANYYRYKKIQDKIKEQGVAEDRKVTE